MSSALKEGIIFDTKLTTVVIRSACSNDVGFDMPENQNNNENYYKEETYRSLKYKEALVRKEGYN